MFEGALVHGLEPCGELIDQVFGRRSERCIRRFRTCCPRAQYRPGSGRRRCGGRCRRASPGRSTRSISAASRSNSGVLNAVDRQCRRWPSIAPRSIVMNDAPHRSTQSDRSRSHPRSHWRGVARRTSRRCRYSVSSTSPRAKRPARSCSGASYSLQGLGTSPFFVLPPCSALPAGWVLVV